MSRGRLLAALAVLAALPDLDVLAFSAGIPYEHWLGHRGLTHSLPFALVLGPVAAAVVFPGVPRFGTAWWRLALLLAMATASHGLLDALTDAGLGVGFWIPFETSRTFFSWRPLAASPIGVGAFFRGAALQILAAEVVVIWLPVLLAATAASFARRARRRAADPVQPPRW